MIVRGYENNISTSQKFQKKTINNDSNNDDSNDTNSVNNRDMIRIEIKKNRMSVLLLEAKWNGAECLLPYAI